jgi:hypothetical protein
MKQAFKPRRSLKIPYLSRAFDLLSSYLADGMYSAGKVEAALEATLGANKKILDCSYATSTGTKVGLPVATVSKHPSYRIFTNYNGVGSRSNTEQGELKSLFERK